MVAEIPVPIKSPKYISIIKMMIVPNRYANEDKRGFLPGEMVPNKVDKSRGLNSAPKAQGRMVAIIEDNSDMV